MNIAIIGSSGAIGSSFVKQFIKDKSVKTIYALSRSKYVFENTKVISKYIDIEDEESIELAAFSIPADKKLDLIIVATGVLYQNNITPEKSINELSCNKFQKIFAINTIGPALVAKHFIKLLRNDQKAIFACISARVGSISDNKLGGWYAYRSSKAALNMVIKNLSIEIARKNKDTIIIGLHPGTVDSNLSNPFQSGVKKDKLFTPEYSVSLMTKVIKKLRLKDSGKIFAYDGKEIEY